MNTFIVFKPQNCVPLYLNDFIVHVLCYQKLGRSLSQSTTPYVTKVEVLRNNEEFQYIKNPFKPSSVFW